jgi:hypothetical protein
MLNLFKNFSRAKVQQANEKVAELLASADPDGMTEAAILEVEEKFREASEEVAKARTDYEREKKEADAIVALQNRRMKAAEKLQADLAVNPNQTDIVEALDELLRLMEEAVPEVEREQREEKEAKEMLDILESNAKEIAEELKKLRDTAVRAKREMMKADQEKETAERREQAALRIAGIKQRSSGYSKAIEAMEKAAISSRQEADAAALRARLLAPSKADSNPLIERALAEAEGQTPTRELSLSERLARLKQSS